MGNGGAAVNGVELIALERERQQTLEGYSREHDEAHKEGEIVDAARAYLDFYGGSSTERAFGNDPGRFGWILEDVRPLAKPVPFRGAQGFFNVPDSLLA